MTILQILLWSSGVVQFFDSGVTPGGQSLREVWSNSDASTSVKAGKRPTSEYSKVNFTPTPQPW